MDGVECMSFNFLSSVARLSCTNFKVQLPNLENLIVYSRVFLGELLGQTV